MRITGGRLRGRRISAPSGRGVRPTTDRVRESLFAVLGSLEDASVLDLFAGSGSLGIEAMSRGAERAVFVERSPAALERLRANLRALDLAEATRVLRAPVAAALGRLERASERFDLVLLDPPYATGDASLALEALSGGALLAPGALVVVEASRRHPPGDPLGLERVDERAHGDTILIHYRRAEPGDSGQEEPGRVEPGQAEPGEPPETGRLAKDGGTSPR